MSSKRVYNVAFRERDFAPVADWDSPHWEGVEVGVIDSYPWGDGSFKPRSQFRLLYTARGLQVIFRVHDRFVRSVAKSYGGPVWKDSCVEFFFTPSTDVTTGYFNVETNCGGTALMAHQRARKVAQKMVDGREARRLAVTHSMPEVVDPEVASPVVWVLAYTIPYALPASRSSMLHPRPGVQWRANFFKCAENNSHPHWGSWSPIDSPKPDFHRPEFFGLLEFE